MYRQGVPEENYDHHMHLEALIQRVRGKPCLPHRTACQSWAFENFPVEMRPLPQEEWTAE